MDPPPNGNWCPASPPRTRRGFKPASKPNPRPNHKEQERRNISVPLLNNQPPIERCTVRQNHNEHHGRPILSTPPLSLHFPSSNITKPNRKTNNRTTKTSIEKLRYVMPFFSLSRSPPTFRPVSHNPNPQAIKSSVAEQMLARRISSCTTLPSRPRPTPAPGWARNARLPPNKRVALSGAGHGVPGHR